MPPAEAQPVVAPAVAPAGSTAGPPKEQHVGVVCVHGIGFQEPGRTLLEWTDAIARALVAWRERIADDDLRPAGAAAWPRDMTEISDVDLSGQHPSFVTFQIPGMASVPDANAQRWTFTESYWATRVEPPSLRLLVDWTGREGMVGKVVQGILNRRHRTGLRHRIVEVAGSLWLGFFISAISSLMLLAFSVVRSIVAILPIPGLKDAVALGKGERFLVGWWGDARSLIRDPVQAANVRKALVESIEFLGSQGCGPIVVLAHSGGTIVSYMTLSDPVYNVRAATLITHGQAITLARRLEDLESDVGVTQIQPSVSRIKAVTQRDDLRVDRWRDFYGSHDPAPFDPPHECKPTVGAPKDRDLAVQITNLTSIREDHGGYWNNDEAFVLPVMTEIERAARGGEGRSRFTRTESGADGRSFTDADGIKARASRVALRSLWGRLALAGPIVSILLAAAMAQGVVADAHPFDVPSDIVAANWASIPLHELGDTVAGWLDGRPAQDGQPVQAGLIPDDWKARVLQLTSATGFVLFMIAAAWAMIPVGGWSEHGPAGWGVADWFTTFVVIVTIVAAIWGLGPIPGIAWAGEFTVALQVVVVILAVSAIVFVMHEFGYLRWVPRTLLSSLIAVAVFVVAGAAVIAFFTDENTRRWIFNALVAFVFIRALVSIGMWRWRSWDAAERQWFRGRRETPKSRLVVYAIATALGILVAAVVAIWGGLAPEIAKSGFPYDDQFIAITAGYGALLILFLVVRDVSTSESVRS